MNQPLIEPRQAKVQWKLQLPKPFAAIQGYGLAVLVIAVSLGASFLGERLGVHDVELPIFLFAIALIAWYGGVGPAVLALVLSCLIFAYYFVEPLYTFYISSAELPYFLVFAAFGMLVMWFGTVRRRVERDLRQVRDNLEIEVAERTQQASLLNLTHDTIFVRDLSDVITYWNRGAQELYGWTAEEAIGKRAHELLQPVFPAPIEEIRAELLRSGRWDGELKKTRADGTQLAVASRWSLRRDELGRPRRSWKAPMTSPSASDGSRKFSPLTKSLRNEPLSLRPLIRNWRHSLIPYRMTSVRPFAIWPGSRSS